MNVQDIEPWDDQTVHDFVNSQINFYQTDNPDAKDRASEVTPWKIWLWLEQHGFDFVPVSLRREFASYFIAPEEGISLARERMMLFQMRQEMRRILGLPELEGEALISLLQNEPVNAATHWSHQGPTGERVDSKEEYDWVASKFIEKFGRDHPEYFSTIVDAENSAGESFEYIDDYVGNGKYTIKANDSFNNYINGLICFSAFAKFYDENLPVKDVYLFSYLFRKMTSDISSSKFGKDFVA